MPGFYEPGACSIVSVFTLAFSRDNRILASGDCRTLSFWDSTTGDLLNRIRFRDFPVSQVGFAPGNNVFAAIQYKKLLLTRINSDAPNEVPETMAADRFAFSPDGESIAVAADRNITLWNLQFLLNKTN
jgi:WD40 repeat protein